MKLRDYQDYAVDMVFWYFMNGGKGNPLVVMPTGTGKSLVLAGIIRRALFDYPGTRVLKLTHVKELIEQNLDKLKRFWPQAPVGVFSAGLKEKTLGLPITFAGIASLARAAAEDIGHIDLLLIDECHLLSTNDASMYLTVIGELLKINPKMKVIGLTATDYRTGFGKLTDGGHIFTDCAVDMSKREQFNWFIKQGYLVPLKPRPTNTVIDTSQVHMRGGDFVESELNEVISASIEAALRESMQYAVDRRKIMVFTSGVENTENIAAVLEEWGESVTYVHSKLKGKTKDGRDKRDAAIEDFKAGKFKWIVNAGILTTGFDDPEVDMIVVLRPTQSTNLWVQILGRGTRPCYMPGFDLDTVEGRLGAIAASHKQYCLVLDFAANAPRLGPINDPVLPTRRGKGAPGIAPIKICDNCGCYNHASVRHCEFCGEEFKFETKINHTAGTAVLVAEDAEAAPPPEPQVIKVDKVLYVKKDGYGDKPDHLEAHYYSGLTRIKHQINLESDKAYAVHKAHCWWREHWAPDNERTEVPATVDEAMTQLSELRTPTHIKVLPSGKYINVIALDFSGTGFGGI